LQISRLDDEQTLTVIGRFVIVEEDDGVGHVVLATFVISVEGNVEISENVAFQPAEI
jgi:hypothetical protein